MPVEVQVIKDRLRKLLENVDMAITTERKLREALEAELGEDLSDRKSLIRQEVNEYLLQQQDAEDGEENGQACGEDEVPDNNAGQKKDESPNDKQGEEDAEDVKPKKKRKNSAFGSILSGPLQKFLGEKSMPRTEVVKRLWVYIKAHELQDPKNKRKIILDDKLETLFKAPLTMFTMNKQLSRHVFSCDARQVDFDEVESEDEEEEEEAPRKKPAGLRKAFSRADRAAAQKAARGKGAQGEDDATEGRRKRRASGGGGACELSPEMQRFLGVQQMPRPQIVKAIWQYIKDQGLQAPGDKRHILPDAKLSTILMPPVTMFSMNKQISKHIFPASKE